MICVLAWLLPGAGHWWLGRRRAGIAFLLAIVAMFAVGVAGQGRLFPFDFTEPLVGLAAGAEVGVGIPYLIAALVGLGDGQVRAVTYEYGNAFIIAAGLLNLLVVIDAYDAAVGRK